jgi:autotransporter-associated beta strand protein
VTLNGGTLDLTDGNLGASGASITFNAQAGTLRNVAELNGGGALTKSTAGTLLLDTANAFTGVTTISAGVLTAAHSSALGTSAGATSVTDGAELRLQGGIAISAEALTLNGTGISAAGALRNFSGNNSFGGTITLATASSITSNAGTLTLTGGVTSTDQNLTIGGAGDVTISTLALNLGTGTLTMNGTGTLLLSVANTFAGATINNGTIKIGVAGSLGSGTVNVGALGTLDLNNQTISNVIVLADGATLTGGTFAASALPTTTGTLDVVLEGAGTTLTKTDGGRLELTGENTYTGATSVSGGGTIAIASFGDTGGASPLGITTLSNPANLVLGGATLEFNGATNTSTDRSFTVEGSAGISATGAGALVFTSDSKIATTGTAPVLTLTASNSGDNVFGATLVEGATPFTQLTIDGAGTWVIGNGANRFKNDVRIEVNGGTLGLRSDALPGDAMVALGDGSTVRWETGNTSAVKLSLEGGSDATLALGTNAVTLTTAPVVTGVGEVSLTKTGAGTLTIGPGFSGASVNVEVSTGTLAVNGIIGDITLSSGARLGGDGTFGTATVALGATVAPGNSPGTFNGETLILNGGSVFEWEVQNATSSTGYDKINLTGNLDLTGANPGSKVIFKVISRLGAGDGNNPGDPLNFDPPGVAAQPTTFQFGVVGGVLLNSGQNISDVFEFNFDDFTYSDGSFTNASLWSINWNGSTLITVTAVPEPSTYGFGLGALALAAAAIRRRRKQQAKPAA